MDTDQKTPRAHGGATGRPFLALGEIEKKLSWTNGSAIARAQSERSRCRGNILRNEVAIGACFPNLDSKNTWYLDGKRVLTRDASSTNRPNDLIVLPPGREFQCQCRGSGQGFWLFIDQQTIVDDPRVKSFMQRATVDSSWVKDRLLWTIASEIRKEGSNGFPRGPLFLEHAAAILITQLAFVLDEAKPRLKQTHAIGDIKLRMVIDYMESNIHRNLALSELAALTELTPSYFCAAFRQATGRPPHQFLIERRVERAKTLLLGGDASLIDIALAVGFNSQSHLGAYFRRIVGVTPARYRAETTSRTVD